MHCARVPINTKTPKVPQKIRWCFQGVTLFKTRNVESVFCTETLKVCKDVNHGATTFGRHYGVISVTECKQVRVSIND